MMCPSSTASHLCISVYPCYPVSRCTCAGCACICVPMYVNTILSLGWCSLGAGHLVLKIGSLTGAELADSIALAGQWVSGIQASTPSTLWVFTATPGFCIWVLGLQLRSLYDLHAADCAVSPVPVFTFIHFLLLLHSHPSCARVAF